MRVNNTGFFRETGSFATRILHRVMVAFLAFLPVFGCVYPYNPDLDEVKELLVIDGHIIKGEPIQTITISRSTVYSNPQFYPETGCLVNVVDDQGNNFRFTETAKGIYTSQIPDEKIRFNATYQLFVTTPDNHNYESTPELLLKDVPVDRVYYVEEPGQTAATGNMEGIQVYTDLKAEEGNARNYRWVMEETWEYERSYPIELKYDGLKKQKVSLLNSDTLVVCWKTQPVVGFFSSSTEGLKVNEKKRIPLNYISSLTNRLYIRYSLLVKQYSMSESAYEYFNTKKAETQESGSLYETQPVQSSSNLINADDPAEKVLGYFWASSFSEKRIFIQPPYRFAPKKQCYPWIPDWESLPKLDPDIRNSFYITVIEGVAYTAEEKCFDCTKAGGTRVRPYFW